MVDKKRILIIDDDPVVRELFVKITNCFNAEAVAVSNVNDARTKLKEETRFNLILLDLIMPSESGWEFLDKLHLNTNTANVPVIVITGALLSRHEMDKLLQKTYAVVQKGTFELDKFRKLIDELL